MNMTKKQFRHDMRRGLGSCQLELRRCTDIEEYRQDILWGIQHALAYDAQCEGTRAIYFFDMIELFDDWSEFYTLIADSAKRNIKDPGWRFFHYEEILALMAGAGYAPAQETMDELYELLLRAVQRGRPSGNGIWAAMDNFSRICVSILTNVMQTQEEREVFYLRVLADYGKILARKPTFGVHCEDKWFEMVAEEDIGETRIHELLAQKSSDPDIARYLENNRQRAAKRESYQAMIQSETLKTKTAESLYEKLCVEDWTQINRLRKILRKCGQEEVEKLARLYANEEREELRARILRLFRISDSMSAFDDNGIIRMISDAESENETLREEALTALQETRGQLVRAYALQRLEQQPKDTDALLMLITNYEPGDGKRLISLVKSVSLNENNGAWHGVFSGVRELIYRDHGADKELSEALLPYMLHEGYCSWCRLCLLELMQPRGLLTPELIEECRWDCYMEIREFVDKL